MIQELSCSECGINHRVSLFDFSFFVGRNKDKGNNRANAPEAKLRQPWDRFHLPCATG